MQAVHLLHYHVSKGQHRPCPTSHMLSTIHACVLLLCTLLFKKKQQKNPIRLPLGTLMQSFTFIFLPDEQVKSEKYSP